jgi:hypothetical protein
VPPSNTPEDRDWENFDWQQFARATIQSIEYGDDEAEVLEDRVTRLEEVTAARWPRRWLLRRRLARELRASVAGLAAPDLPRDFRTRREEWAYLESTARVQDRRRRWEQRQRDAQQGDADPGEGFLP